VVKLPAGKKRRIMIMIKIMYVVLLSAILVVSISGCGSKEGTQDDHPALENSTSEHPTSEHPK